MQIDSRRSLIDQPLQPCPDEITLCQPPFDMAKELSTRLSVQPRQKRPPGDRDREAKRDAKQDAGQWNCIVILLAISSTVPRFRARLQVAACSRAIWSGSGRALIWAVVYSGLILRPIMAADRPNTAKLNDATLRLIATGHYEIHTDLDDALATDLAARMDVMYDQYARNFPDFKLPPRTPALAVYLFATHEKYMAFTDYAGVNTGGLFVAGRRSYLAAYEQGQGRDALRRTLQHEAFHQFAHAAIAAHLPPWLNEGLAQCFEESIWVGRDFLTGQVPPRRLRQLQIDISQKRLIEFDQFMAMTGHDWSDTLHTDIQKAGTFYNQAWAMACFCSSDPDYHADLLRLLQKLHTNDGYPDSATRQCFADLKTFRKKFNLWAARVQATAEATLLEHQDTLGDLLLAVQQNKLPIPANMAGFRELSVKYGLKIQYTRGGVTYNTADQPIVYFSNLAGQVCPPEDLFFEPNANAPLPDIVRHTAKLGYRTRFYISAGKTEHETLVTPVDSMSPPDFPASQP